MTRLPRKLKKAINKPWRQLRGRERRRLDRAFRQKARDKNGLWVVRHHRIVGYVDDATFVTGTL